MATYADTPRYMVRYPLGTAPTNVPGTFQNSLDTVDSIITPTYVGRASTRPVSGTYTAPSASGQQGRRYYTTTHGKISFDTGTGWVAEGPINTVTGNITSSAPGATGSAGSTGYSADAGHTHPREAWGAAATYKPSGTASAGSSGRVADAAHVHPGLSVGVPIPWPGTSVPPGYLLLAGQLLPRATYPILFSYYGTTWTPASHAPPSTSTFYMPNFINRVLAGAGPGSTFTVGRYRGNLSHFTPLKPHQHTVPRISHYHTGTTATESQGHHHTPYGATSGHGFAISVATKTTGTGTSKLYFNVGAYGVHHTYTAAAIANNDTSTQNLGHTHTFVTAPATTGIIQTTRTGTTTVLVSAVQPTAGVQWITLAG